MGTQTCGGLGQTLRPLPVPPMPGVREETAGGSTYIGTWGSDAACSSGESGGPLCDEKRTLSTSDPQEAQESNLGAGTS